MEKQVLDLGGKPVVLYYNAFENEVNIDELTGIDYANLYGEAVTISALLSKLGVMRAEAEKYMSECKLDHDIYEAKLKRNYRQYAAANAGRIALADGTLIKLTENGLDEVIKGDADWKKNKQSTIEAKKQYDYIDSLFWAASSKDKKLNNIVKAVTPEELYDELIEGAINTILIKKPEIKYGQRNKVIESE